MAAWEVPQCISIAQPVGRAKHDKLLDICRKILMARPRQNSLPPRVLRGGACSVDAVASPDSVEALSLRRPARSLALVASATGSLILIIIVLSSEEACRS